MGLCFDDVSLGRGWVLLILRSPDAASNAAHNFFVALNRVAVVRTPIVVDAVVEKVAQKRITNSKDLRKLRSILPDPVAREHFLCEEGDLESAMLRLGAPPEKKKDGLSIELVAVAESIKRVPWTALAELKKDPEIIKKIDEASALLQSLRSTLVS